MKYSKFTTSWQVSDSAPAKLVQAGRQSLTNSEILSVAAGITMDQARSLMALVGNDLQDLGKLSVSEFSQISGISTAIGARLSAIFELGRRRSSSGVSPKQKIRCSQDASRILSPLLSDLAHEEFHVLLLNRANMVIDVVKISQGGISGTVTDVRLIINAAVSRLASGLILAHNHPSGNSQPSEADLKITRKIKEAAQFLDISLLDHLIITDGSYLSMADDNLLP